MHLNTGLISPLQRYKKAQTTKNSVTSVHRAVCLVEITLWQHFNLWADYEVQKHWKFLATENNLNIQHITGAWEISVERMNEWLNEWLKQPRNKRSKGRKMWNFALWFYLIGIRIQRVHSFRVNYTPQFAQDSPSFHLLPHFY